MMIKSAWIKIKEACRNLDLVTKLAFTEEIVYRFLITILQRTEGYKATITSFDITGRDLSVGEKLQLLENQEDILIQEKKHKLGMTADRDRPPIKGSHKYPP